MPDVNIPLLRKAVEWAEAEAAKGWADSRWFQGLWTADGHTLVADDFDAAEFGIGAGAMKSPECGTCYCIAGYVAFEVLGRSPIDGPVPGMNARTIAAEHLGVDPEHPLFGACNSIEDVRRIAEEIAGERL